MNGQFQPPFVPEDFAVPGELVTDQFRLQPLGPEHNAEDYQAWTSSAWRGTRSILGSRRPSRTGRSPLQRGPGLA